MHPVALAASGRTEVWIATDNIFRCFVETVVVKVLVTVPFPDNISFPIYFDDRVVKKRLVGNLSILHCPVAENQGVAFVNFRCHARHIVSCWVACTLEVMMLTSHPTRLFTGIFDILMLIEFPGNITFPVYLH